MIPPAVGPGHEPVPQSAPAEPAARRPWVDQRELRPAVPPGRRALLLAALAIGVPAGDRVRGDRAARPRRRPLAGRHERRHGPAPGGPPAGRSDHPDRLAGHLTQPWQLVVLMLAVGLLTLQAIAINRLAGVPNPLWSPASAERAAPGPGAR